MKPVKHCAYYLIRRCFCVARLVGPNVRWASGELGQHSSRVDALPITNKCFCSVFRLQIKDSSSAACGRARHKVIDLPGSRLPVEVLRLEHPETALARVLYHKRQSAFDKGCTKDRRRDGGGVRIGLAKFGDRTGPPKPKWSVAQPIQFLRESVEWFGKPGLPSVRRSMTSLTIGNARLRSGFWIGFPRLVLNCSPGSPRAP